MNHTERFKEQMQRNAPMKKEKHVKIIEKLIEVPEDSSFFQRTLGKCTYAGDTVYLPKERLENYIDLKKAFENVGAKYKNNTFVFQNDAEPFIKRLMNGDSVNIKKEFQFFPTPPHVAQKVVDSIYWDNTINVIGEFSAGQGGLLDFLPKKYEFNIVELMPENVEILNKKGYKAQQGDFLSKHWGMVDLIVLNPPFSKNQDIMHFMHAWDHLNEKGQISCITSPHWLIASDKKSKDFRAFIDDIGATYEEISAGEFKSSGTNIKTILVKAYK